MRDFHRPGRSALFAENGMAATSHPLASHPLASLETLKRGGDAADAAVAAAVLLGVSEPQMTGLGGDAFALVKPAGEERLVGLNGSGRAPGAGAAPAFACRPGNRTALRRGAATGRSSGTPKSGRLGARSPA